MAVFEFTWSCTSSSLILIVPIPSMLSASSEVRKGPGLRKWPKSPGTAIAFSVVETPTPGVAQIAACPSAIMRRVLLPQTTSSVDVGVDGGNNLLNQMFSQFSNFWVHKSSIITKGTNY